MLMFLDPFRPLKETLNDKLTMSYAHRYDLKDTSKVEVIDMSFMCAMGPPGGARNPVTGRFLRHFNHIACLDFTDETMQKIFNTLMVLSLRYNEFSSDILKVAKDIVTATQVVSAKYLRIFVCHIRLLAKH